MPNTSPVLRSTSNLLIVQGARADILRTPIRPSVNLEFFLGDLSVGPTRLLYITSFQLKPYDKLDIASAMWSSRECSISTKILSTNSFSFIASALSSTAFTCKSTSRSICSTAYMTAPMVLSLSRISRYLRIAFLPRSSGRNSSARI